jgi:hypothetical protein
VNDGHEPEGMIQARRAAAAAIAMARANVAAMLSTEDAWRRIDREQLDKLYCHAWEAPNARALADFLADMVPNEFLQSNNSPIPSDGEAIRKSVAFDIKSRKLFSAVIEAGLAEQQGVDGNLLVGSSFNAQALETLLDEWLRAGQYRGAFDGSPLSEIDKMVSRHAEGAGDAIQTRLGLLVPVATAIHIWRLCESLPPDHAQRLGWHAQDEAQPGPVH